VLGVRVHSAGFAVDVLDPDDPLEFNVIPIICAASDVPGGRIFLANDTNVCAFDGVAILWVSRRVSLDGVSDLRYSNERVDGVGYDVGGDALSFSIDARTGEADGGFTGFQVIG